MITSEPSNNSENGTLGTRPAVTGRVRFYLRGNSTIVLAGRQRDNDIALF